MSEENFASFFLGILVGWILVVVAWLVFREG